MENQERNIKLIWDFRGEDGLQTAKHHEIHLREFANKEQIPFEDSGVEEESELHAVAYITVKEPFMKSVRDALIPHRGEIAEWASQKKLWSQRHPLFYFISVWEKRIRKRIEWKTDSKVYTSEISEEKLPFRVKKHQSKLLKKLGESDMQLQFNKIDNLKLVVEKINGTLIKPGETFSFCKTAGLPTKRKGYKLGMELSFGEAKAGIGGGICQSSNLMHWLALHSPLTINERHHHSFDPFPDDGRVLPFASGATVFYNYLDFQLTNNTEWTFQINLWLTEKLLEGEIRIDQELDFNYHVFEKNHRFIKKENEFFRTNEIWRTKNAKFRSGELIKQELMFKNYGKVKYVPEEFE